MIKFNIGHARGQSQHIPPTRASAGNNFCIFIFLVFYNKLFYIYIDSFIEFFAVLNFERHEIGYLKEEVLSYSDIGGFSNERIPPNENIHSSFYNRAN